MATSEAATVKEYIDSLSPERRAAIQKVRRIIRKNLPPGFKEGMQYGYIGYYVPLSRLADTYNGEPLSVACLASQKNHMAVYLMSVYGSPKLKRWFEQEYRKSGKKLDMGKSCVRFRSVDDLPLDLIGKAIASVSVDDYVAVYEKSTRGRRTKPASKARQASKGGAGKATKAARAPARKSR
jgi:uncharacterized protein YdhG (YjbR/CyaY superfamily)